MNPSKEANVSIHQASQLKYFSLLDCKITMPDSRHNFLCALSALKLFIDLRTLPELDCLKDDISAASMYLAVDNGAEIPLWTAVLSIYVKHYTAQAKPSNERLSLDALVRNCTIDYFLKALTEFHSRPTELARISAFLSDVGVKPERTEQDEFSVHMFNKATELLLGPAHLILKHTEKDAHVICHP